MRLGVLADTGPLYAANDRQDEHHRRALRELHRFSDERVEILIPYPILLEAYSLVLYRLGRTAAILWLDEVSESLFVSPAAEDYAQGLTTVRKFTDQRVTLVDATVAAMASRMGVKVWTYDHHFDVMRVQVWR